MPETPDTAHEIKQIRFKLESIEGTQELLLKEKADALRAQLKALFDDTPQLKEVYLAVNGESTQAEIVDALKATGLKTSQPTVSRRMTTLEEHGLIEKIDSPKGTVLKKKDVIERVLRLSRVLNGRT